MDLCLDRICTVWWQLSVRLSGKQLVKHNWHGYLSIAFDSLCWSGIVCSFSCNNLSLKNVWTQKKLLEPAKYKFRFHSHFILFNRLETPLLADKDWSCNTGSHTTKWFYPIHCPLKRWIGKFKSAQPIRRGRLGETQTARTLLTSARPKGLATPEPVGVCVCARVCVCVGYVSALTNRRTRTERGKMGGVAGPAFGDPRGWNELCLTRWEL